MIFDSDKEGFYILYRQFASDGNFKILGVFFDTQLKMHAAVRELAIQGGWRLKALLRTKRFFSLNQLVMLYKSQVLSYLESGSVAFFHAPATTMNPLDRIQQRFLREIGISTHEAISRFKLFPLLVRRQIAALGTLHRRVLGLAPSAIADLLPFAPLLGHSYNTRLQ